MRRRWAFFSGLLTGYRYTWHPDRGVFSKEPEHSKHSHGADVARVFALADREEAVDDGWRPSEMRTKFDVFTYGGGR